MEAKTLDCGCVQTLDKDGKPFCMKKCESHPKKEGFQGSVNGLLENQGVWLYVGLVVLLLVGIAGYLYMNDWSLPSFNLFQGAKDTAGSADITSS